MFGNILVPLDGTPRAERALPYAIALAGRAGGRIHVVHVTEPVEVLLAHATTGADGGTPTEPTESARQYLDGLTYRLRETKVPFEVDMRTGMVLEALRAVLAEGAPDLVVLTMHRDRGPNPAWGGSIAREALLHAHCPVLMVPTGDDDAEVAISDEPVLDELLVPLDGSDLSTRILPHAEALARLMGARLTLLTVDLLPIGVGYPPVPHGALLEPVDAAAHAAAELTRLAEPMRQRSLAVETAVTAAPDAADEILRQAIARQARLIAMATHGRGAVLRALMGSVAQQVLRHADTPVLLFRPDED